jgi:anti-sigma factor RsiW
MTPDPRGLELMHAALDGEATAEELQELERLLAADPGARAEYDALRRLFDALQALPQLDPPPGLAESVAERRQLWLSRRVLGTASGQRAPATPTTAGTRECR